MKIEQIPGVLLCALLASASHASDGELAWTSVSFCNGAGYCIDLASTKGVGIDSMHMKRNGKEIALPKDLPGQNELPILDEVRFINVLKTDGVSENRLEVPLLARQQDAEKIFRVLNVVIVDDRFSETYITRNGVRESSLHP
jgi:hypothetical protein